MLDGAQELVGRGQPSSRVLDGRQTSVESGADVTYEHVSLVRVVDPPQLHCPRRLELEEGIQLIGDDGLVKPSGKFAGLLHRSGACQDHVENCRVRHDGRVSSLIWLPKVERRDAPR